MRTALRRAVTEAIGYSLTKSWTKTIILTMDDIGNAQNSWLEHWHYPELSEEQIRNSMIETLAGASRDPVAEYRSGLCR